MYKRYYLGWGLLTSNINMSWRTSVNLVAGHAVDCVCVWCEDTLWFLPAHLALFRRAKRSQKQQLTVDTQCSECVWFIISPAEKYHHRPLWFVPLPASDSVRVHLSGELLGLTLTNNKNM